MAIDRGKGCSHWLPGTRKPLVWLFCPFTLAGILAVVLEGVPSAGGRVTFFEKVLGWLDESSQPATKKTAGAAMANPRSNRLIAISRIGSILWDRNSEGWWTQATSWAGPCSPTPEAADKPRPAIRKRAGQVPSAFPVRSKKRGAQY